ncbi:MAG: ribonuclease HI, partial [Pseudobdellovibrio sp.]
KGHAGIEGNERCDVIAVAYSKNDYVDLYKGSTEDYRFDINVMPITRPLPEFKNKTSEEKKNSWYLSYVNGVLTKHKTWPECEAVVKGRPAKFKKVSSEAEEVEVKKSWGIN